MEIFPKDIKNIILKKKEQLKYQDLINEFKDMIHKFKKQDINYELRRKFNNGPIFISESDHSSYKKIMNFGLSIFYLTNVIKILKDNNKACILCANHTYLNGYKIYNRFIFCNSCFSGKCGCMYNKDQKNYYYSYKNCDYCEYIFDNQFYVN